MTRRTCSKLLDNLRFRPTRSTAVVLFAVGCSGTDDGSGPAPTTMGEIPNEGGEVIEPGVRDVSPTLPEVGDDVMRIELAEQRVEAGEEIQFCHYLEPMEADRYLVNFEQHQGAGGHHLLAFRALDQKPPGTVEVCGTEEMATLIPVFLSSDFVGSEFPNGMAVRVPAGEQLVIQQHYVNTASTAVVSRDVADLSFIPAGDVTTELGFYGISDLGFALSPVPAPQTVTVSCDATLDMSWIMAGPHMHETGKQITVTRQSGEETTTLVRVDEWEAEYRDLPPVSDFSAEPVEIKTGDTLTLSCIFENDTGEELRFPSEMCAVYGYFYPGDQTSLWGCTPDRAAQ